MELSENPLVLTEFKNKSLEDSETEKVASTDDELACFEHLTKFTGRQLQETTQPWWSCNTYNITDQDEKHLLCLNEEESQPTIVRAMCSSNRPFFISAFNSSTKEKVLEFERFMRCCSPIFCPWSRSSIIVRDKRAQILGYVKHAARETCASWLGPSLYYEVADAELNIKYIILGPGGCIMECTKPNMFEVMTADSSRQIGEIFHDWRGCCGGCFSFCLSPNVDQFNLRVDKDISVTDKALLLGALILAHFNYMEVL